MHILMRKKFPLNYFHFIPVTYKMKTSFMVKQEKTFHFSLFFGLFEVLYQTIKVLTIHV